MMGSPNIRVPKSMGSPNQWGLNQWGPKEGVPNQWGPQINGVPKSMGSPNQWGPQINGVPTNGVPMMGSPNIRVPKSMGSQQWGPHNGVPK